MKVLLQQYTHDSVETIYRAYRLCYSKEEPSTIKIPMTVKEHPVYDEVTVPDEEAMLTFIRKYVELGHVSPLEHISFTFVVEGVSRALTHQLVRHRIASFNQQSQRYVNAKNFGFVTPPAIEANRRLSRLYDNTIATVRDSVTEMAETLKEIYLEEGLSNRDAETKANEDARYLLPNATETNIMITMNGRALLEFLGKRLCLKAQWEISKMAEEMRELANIVIPLYKLTDVMNCRTCGEECIRNAHKVGAK